MPVKKTVLVVTPTPSLGAAVLSCARAVGYDPVCVRDFGEAKRRLASEPDLLVTELKLGEYNGLHLALRALHSEIPALVVADESYHNEVDQVGAVWVSPSATHTGELPNLMVRLLQGSGAAGHYADVGTSQSDEHPTFSLDAPPDARLQ